jgi:hypothetical protein
MTALGYRLWTVGSETRYVRVIGSYASVVSADQIAQAPRRVPIWQTNEKTLHLVLATAYGLQPTAWWSSQ